MDASLLAQRLTKMGYVELFRRADERHVLDEIWNSGPQQDFERLVADPTMPALARFLSSQILLKKDLTFLSRVDLSALSQVYVQAMLGNYTAAMSDWGFLESNDDLGVVGSIFLVFGERATTQLLDLLNDDTVVQYEREPRSVSSFNRTKLQRIRVKDFAALYLSKIKNLPIEFNVSFDERDKEIAALKNKFSSG